MSVSSRNGVKLKEETWKDIDGFPGYQAGTEGHIRSSRDYHGNITSSYHLLKPRINKDGYYELSLYTIDHKRLTKRVHKLIASTFLGEHDDLVVDHKNGNKLDNRLDNLRLVAASENSTLAAEAGLYKTKPVKIVETGEIFNSRKECGKAIGYHPCDIGRCLSGKKDNIGGFHFEAADETMVNKQRSKPILYDFQMEAVKKGFSGCIFNGGVGSGKSRTGLYFYFSQQGGSYVGSDYVPMKNPKDLYIITTAAKRDKGEWITELALFRMNPDPELNYYDNKIVIDSWNNIKKYTSIKDGFFVFDEDKVCGGGAWTKAFLKITKSNDWIILSATCGDTWMDYWSVFVANGFYKNKTEFIREHVIYSRYTRYPQIDRYINTQRLMRLRDKILIDMTFQRHTVPHHEDVYCSYDIPTYKDVFKKRWDPYKNEPIKQASELCYLLRKIVNSDESRQAKLLELLEDHPRAIIFYSYDYERDILLSLGYSEGTKIAEWTGHKHEPIPESEKWIYLVNYASGAEGFNCISTDTIIFYSQTYSYKTLVQAAGRIDRLNTKFIDLYYYHLKSRSGIDLAISKALKEKKAFNETRWDRSWK